MDVGPSQEMRFKKVFLYAGLQFCGHMDEYFAAHTEELTVFLIQPRIGQPFNLLRTYSRGKLTLEQRVTSSTNFFLYYFLWYANHMRFLLRYCHRDSPTTVVVFHPLVLLGMSIQKVMRRAAFVYWIGDYFPPTGPILWIYERLKKFYHDRVSAACYLSDAINLKMNGQILDTDRRKTVMWGVRARSSNRHPALDRFTILFIGVIKVGQGIEVAYDVLKDHPGYSLKVIGPCSVDLYRKHMALVDQRHIASQVFFSNRAVYGAEFDKLTEDCHVGIALYNTDPMSFTHFADPGKVKAYTEMGIPVVMSDISSTAEYVRSFKCGEVIVPDSGQLAAALERIRFNYPSYLAGVARFNKHFFFDDYYRKAFSFMEHRSCS